MNPDQLELAAHHYCKLMGLDPEASIPHPDYAGSAANFTRWKLVAQELRVHWAMNDALREGMWDQ